MAFHVQRDTTKEAINIFAKEDKKICEFISYSVLFGLTALSVFMLVSNQNEQIRNQKEMCYLLRAIMNKK